MAEHHSDGQGEPGATASAAGSGLWHCPFSWKGGGGMELDRSPCHGVTVSIIIATVLFSSHP